MDRFHDTLWLNDSANGSSVDLLAPADAHWPGTGATTFIEWLDNDRLAFMKHCGTGCTSLEIINVRTRAHVYFCTDGTFYLSPDKHHAVGETPSRWLVTSEAVWQSWTWSMTGAPRVRKIASRRSGVITSACTGLREFKPTI